MRQSGTGRDGRARSARRALASLAVAAAVVLAVPLFATSASAAPPGGRGGGNGGGSADAGTGDCQDYRFQAECDQLTPTFSCVFDNGDGSFTAALGYRNPTDVTLTAKPGQWDNAFNGYGGLKSDLGQISTFPPGTSTTAFTITWKPSANVRDVALTWQLGSTPNSVSFSRASTACASHPVTQLGNWLAAGAALLLSVPALAIVNRRRLRAVLTRYRSV